MPRDQFFDCEHIAPADLLTPEYHR